MLLSRLYAALSGDTEARILVLGLDNAGKTTILYRMQVGEVVSTIPTIGFNVETVTYKKRVRSLFLSPVATTGA